MYAKRSFGECVPKQEFGNEGGCQSPHNGEANHKVADTASDCHEILITTHPRYLVPKLLFGNATIETPFRAW